MTAEQAKLLSAALTGAYDDQKSVARGACKQASEEILCVLQAIFNGASDDLVCTALQGIAERLSATAELAGLVELAAEGAAE